MADTLTLAAKRVALLFLIGREHYVDELELRLFTNDKSYTATDIVSDYHEPNGGGYKPIRLDSEKWVVKGTVASYPPEGWVFDGEVGKVFGYFVTRAKGGELIFAHRFEDGPHSMSREGDSIGVTLQIGGR